MSNTARVIEHEPKALQVTAPNESPLGSALAFLQAGGNVDQLDHMMDLQERWESNEARKAFTVAMAGFKSEPMEILKAKLVEFRTRDGDLTSYRHAELSDITDVVGPALAKHSLAWRWDVEQSSAGIKVDCILTHAKGHAERVTMTAGADSSGKKNAIQQIASTVTYLQRYTLLAITGMATKGMDDDGRNSEEGTESGPEVDVSDWYAAIEAATDMQALNALANELKAAGLTGRALRNVRAAWAKRSKDVAK